MLIITRKIGQRVLIASDIVIEVRDIRGSQVRLGVSAPLALPVYREELYQQIASENARACDVSMERMALLDVPPAPPPPAPRRKKIG